MCTNLSLSLSLRQWRRCTKRCRIVHARIFQDKYTWHTSGLLKHQAELCPRPGAGVQEHILVSEALSDLRPQPLRPMPHPQPLSVSSGIVSERAQGVDFKETNGVPQAVESNYII